jgi:hypothetical protein
MSTSATAIDLSTDDLPVLDGEQSRRCSPGSDTQRPPRRWTPTRICGRTRTIRRGRPSILRSRSILLRTPRGQTQPDDSISAGQQPGADELACKPDPVASQARDQLRRVLLACY